MSEDLEPLVVLKAMSKEKSWLERAIEAAPTEIMGVLEEEMRPFTSLPFLEIHKMSPPYAFVECLKEIRSYEKEFKGKKRVYEFVDVEKLEPKKQKDGSYALVPKGKFTLSLGIATLNKAMKSFVPLTGKKFCVAWYGKKDVEGYPQKLHDYRVKLLED